MYPLPANPNAIEILERSISCHPAAFRDALAERARVDMVYANSHPDGASRAAILASAAATQRAIAAIDDDAFERFADDMGAGIIALSIACKLQCLPAWMRTSAAIATWGDNA